MRPKDIVLAPNSELLVTWEDGSTSVLDPLTLRRRCPCATCRELRGELAHALPAPQKMKMGGPLAMAQGPRPEDVEAVAMRQVGNYAIAIKWRDGHDTGIYSYKFLRELAST